MSSCVPVKLHGMMEVGRFDKPVVKSDLEVVPKLFYLLLSAAAYGAGSGLCTHSVVDR